MCSRDGTPPDLRGKAGDGGGGATREDAGGWKMEEAVVKQGVLYLQLQQTFGKVRGWGGGAARSPVGGGARLGWTWG